MSVNCVGDYLVGKIVAAGMLRDARLQRALRRVTTEIIGSLPTPVAEKDFGLLQANGGKFLKILPSQGMRTILSQDGALIFSV